MNKTFVTESDFARFCQRSQTRHLFQPFFVCAEGFAFWAKVAVFTTLFYVAVRDDDAYLLTRGAEGTGVTWKTRTTLRSFGAIFSSGSCCAKLSLKNRGEQPKVLLMHLKKINKKITCVLWCPKIYPNIKQYKTTHQQILSWLHHLWCSGFKPWLFLACYQQSVQNLDDIKHWCWIYILRNPKCLYQGSQIEVIKSLITYLIPFSGVT